VQSKKDAAQLSFLTAAIALELALWILGKMMALVGSDVK
jgi:hypothetical protein